MDKLSSVRWKSFVLSDIFTISSGKRLTKADMKVGKRPFIGATDSNNGITAWVDNTNESLDKLVLGVNYNGSVVETFFHPYECIFSDDVKRLHLKNGITSYHVMLFLKTMIIQQKVKFEYGYKFNEKRMQRQKILLPVTEDNSPDWQFMEEYMRGKETLLLKPAVEKLCKRLIHKEILGGVKWQAFFLEEIAQISSGKDIYERERTSGQTPYVTATANNNGIGYFIGNQNETLERGSLSVNRNGSVGYCFYHPYDALYGNDTRKLRPIRSNKYVSLFISMCITNQRAKYGYGYKMGTGRLKRQKILLPVDSCNQPNWEYMETYMLNLEQKQILEYLKHIER